MSAYKRRRSPRFLSNRALIGAAGLYFLACAAALGADKRPAGKLRIIGATATFVESTSGIPFAARVDTGATTTSIHCEAMEIDGASENPLENVGKRIRFLVKNKKDQSRWLDAEIVDYVEVQTSERADGRYKVRLALRWQDFEKKVLVTLNDRSHMTYPLLIGRNFLHNAFVVNVAWEGSDRGSAKAKVRTAAIADDTIAMNEALEDEDANALLEGADDR